MDKKIIYIHGINSPIERTEYCIQKISDYAGGQKTTGIYNPTNGAYRDGFEYSERAKPVFLIRSQAEKELSYHLTSFHLTAPPSAKALLISYSGGTTEARNGLYSSLPILRYRTLSVALAPSAIIPDNLCYLSWNYASKNDLVPKYALKMTPWLANQVTFLDPHPTASKWNDHDWDSRTYQIQLAEDVGIYMKRTY